MTQGSLDDVLSLSLTEFFKFCRGLKYGWVDEDGRITKDVDYRKYRLLAPAELVRRGVGICWDQTELQRAWFEAHGYESATYLLYYQMEDCCLSHSVLVYRDGDEWVWFEPMFHRTWVEYCGIHKYNSLDELLKDFQQRFFLNGQRAGLLPKVIEDEDVFLYEYTKPKYHITDEEFFAHCRSGKDMRPLI